MFVETMTFFSGFFDKQEVQQTVYIWNRNVNVFTVTLDQLNASLLNKMINFFKKELNWPFYMVMYIEYCI